MDDSNLISLYIGLGTVLGALAGGFISTLLTREHKISTFRQEWVDKVRDVMSAILAQGEVYADVAYQDNEKAYREKVKLIENICQLKLFLNRAEDPSKTLLDTIEKIPDEYFGKSGGKDRYAEIKRALADKMQDVLKQDWNRVRDGELVWATNKALSKYKFLSRIKLTRLRLATIFSVASFVFAIVIMVKVLA